MITSRVSNITLAAGTQSVSTTIETVEDRVVEGDETFSIRTLFFVGVQTIEYFTITIVDDDQPSWSVTADPELIAEEGTVTSSTVTVRTGGVTFPDAKTVALAFTGTATKDTDYTVGAESLTLAVGENSVQTTVTASADTDEEDIETIAIAASVDGASVGDKTIRLLNGAGVPVSFGRAAYSAGEGGSVTVSVTLGAAPDAPVTVTLTTTPGPNLEMDEWSGVPDSVTFNAAETSRSFTVTFTDDETDESNERLTLGLGSTLPEGYVPGHPSQAVITLVDDDEGPPAPRYFSVAASSQNGIAVSWFSERTAVEYKLEYRKGGSSDWTRVTAGDFDRLPSTSSNRHLLGVAANLDCETAYNFRVSFKGDGERYLPVFGAHATLWASTGECARENRATNLRVSIEPECATLSWTAPTGGDYTGVRVRRLTLPRSSDTGQDPASSDTEQDPAVIHEDLTDSRTSYRDCKTSGDGYGDADHTGYSYRVSYIKGGVVDANGNRAVDESPFVFVPVRSHGPNFHWEPDPPHNVRFTTNTQGQRRLAWEPAPSHHLTIERVFRGQATGPVADPWLTGYRVERRVYEGDGAFPTHEDVTLLSATLTAAERYDGLLRGYSDASGASYGELTPSAFSSYNIARLSVLISDKELSILVVPEMSQGVLDSLMLVIDGAEFPLSDARDVSTTHNVSDLRWSNSGISWAVGQEVSVELRERRPLDWEVLREGNDRDTSATFTDNEDAGDKLYVYRVMATNADNSSSEHVNFDWLWMDPP